jgi:hypothetical protein
MKPGDEPARIQRRPRMKEVVAQPTGSKAKNRILASRD